MTHAPIYVHRPVLNQRWIVNHFFDQGVRPMKDDLHVTVVYSKGAMGWEDVYADPSALLLPSTSRQLACFGPPDDEVLVLLVDHPHLHDRHLTWLAGGATTDYPEYRPHITVTKTSHLSKAQRVGPYIWKSLPPSFQNLKPYTQDVLLGPEQIGPLMMPNA